MLRIAQRARNYRVKQQPKTAGVLCHIDCSCLLLSGKGLDSWVYLWSYYVRLNNSHKGAGSNSH